MLTRLTHAAIAFAVTAVVYQLYAVGVVPFVEPAAVSDGPASKHPHRAGPPPHKHRELLGAYFPADHWCLRQPPKTIYSGHAMIVFDDYQQFDDGKLEIKQCVLIYFPDGREQGAAAPRNAIILEAPGGAVLQMDNSLGAGPTSIGKLQWGELKGRIHIYSDMRERGPTDDLRIVTRDLRLNESGLNTRAAVEMQIGEHTGRGKGLEIRRLSEENNGASVLSGLDTLEISSEVTAKLAVGEAKFVGDKSAAQPNEFTLSTADGRELPAKPQAAEPPIRIQCAGAFRYDFANNKASFLQDVVARQVHADGKLNQLHAEELNLYLIRSARTKGEDAMRRSGLASGLEPGTLEAKGSPVVLDAPSHEASIRGERIRIQIPQRLITVDGGDEVTLKHRGSEIHAPMVQYRQPANDSDQQIGEMTAAGRGWLKAVVDKRRPRETLEVSWSTSMRLDRDGEQPVLSVIGRPRLAMPGVGRLMADQMHVFLRESSSPLPDQISTGSADKPEGPTRQAGPTISADRLVATGAVSIDAPELNCRVNELTLWMKYAASETADGDTKKERPSDGLGGELRRRSSRRAYAVNGDKLALLVTVRNRKPDVTRVSVDGNVLFQESPGPGQQDPPLRIVARQLQVEGADTANAEITILGSPRTKHHGAVPAEITVRGTTIRAPQLRLNRGASQAWIKEAGEVQMQMDRDFQGQPLNRPEPMTISWRDSMQLDGDRIKFNGNVIVRNASGWMQTPRLAVQLSAPVRFDGAAASKPPDLAQIECYDGVLAEFDDHDAAGMTSHQRVELRSLVANQITGELSGDGPGRIESVHLSTGGNPLAKLTGSENRRRAEGPAQILPKNSGPVQKLRYLRTEFSRNITGNLLRREVWLHGNVRTVYGPVDAWEQKLNPAIGEEPAPYTIHIECDHLGVAESPAGRLFSPPRPDQKHGRQRLGPIELMADGHVTIEGMDPKHGSFTARGERASYDQLKTMFVLKGGPNAPAKLWRQEYVGAPASGASGKVIRYWINTGELDGTGIGAEGIQYDAPR